MNNNQTQERTIEDLNNFKVNSAKRFLLWIAISVGLTVATVYLYKNEYEIWNVISLFITIFSYFAAFCYMRDIDKANRDLQMASENFEEYKRIEEERINDDKAFLAEMENKEKSLGVQCPYCHFANPRTINASYESKAKISVIKDENGAEYYYCKSCYNRFEIKTE